MNPRNIFHRTPSPDTLRGLAMRIHHINAGTMCPASAKLVNGEGTLGGSGKMICHCLLVESDDGLILVDTGLGLEDVADASKRLGAAFLWATRPALDPEETAARQVKRLGFRRADVRHVLPTHLDLDHAGGLPDFPEATVHIFEPEHAAAMRRATFLERARYKPVHWAHGPRWLTHALEGDQWLGFDAVRAIPGVGPEVLLVPLVGHTRGHSGVAVKVGDRWILHAGDAYFNFREMDPVHPSCPSALAAFQRIAAISNKKRLENQARLRELARTHAGDIDVICAHCPDTFDRSRRAGPQAGA
jgi:glyoxylase-like metal-dependent hydrolase (beta-lactamase superfamily II)